MVLAEGKGKNGGYSYSIISKHVEQKCKITVSEVQIERKINKLVNAKVTGPWDPADSAKLLLEGIRMYVERGNTQRARQNDEPFYAALEKAVCPGRGVIATMYEYERMKNAKMGPIRKEDIQIILRVHEEQKGNSGWKSKASETLDGRSITQIQAWVRRNGYKYPQFAPGYFTSPAGDKDETRS